jgi:hypothetical protein
MSKWDVFKDAIQSWPTTFRLFVLLAAPGLGVGIGYELARLLIFR